MNTQKYAEDKDLRKIANRLLLLRRKHNLTQKSLGEMLGVTGRYISTWESGKSWLPFKYVVKICRLFQVDLEYFAPDNPDFQKYLDHEL